MGMDMDMMMPMYFSQSCTGTTWLIYGWDSTNCGQYIAGLVVTFFIGFTIEMLSWVRLHQLKRSEGKGGVSILDRLLISFNYFVSVCLVYILMLLVMTF
mmetsp:Transcript_86857/g.119642  ORF Transcript_86857/g.119642 Transcript_86857/m.119642 type:complete len:99 (+) Transcript_86857:36-332(+)